MRNAHKIGVSAYVTLSLQRHERNHRRFFFFLGRVQYNEGDMKKGIEKENRRGLNTQLMRTQHLLLFFGRKRGKHYSRTDRCG